MVSGRAPNEDDSDGSDGSVSSFSPSLSLWWVFWPSTWRQNFSMLRGPPLLPPGSVEGDILAPSQFGLGKRVGQLATSGLPSGAGPVQACWMTILEQMSGKTARPAPFRPSAKTAIDLDMRNFTHDKLQRMFRSNSAQDWVDYHMISRKQRESSGEYWYRPAHLDTRCF